MSGTLRLEEVVLLPLEHARRGLLRTFGRPLRGLIADRDARVTVHGTTAILLALVLTVVAPVWLLVLGPLVLGVPHLVSDVRYLVCRFGMHQCVAFWGLVVVPLVLATLTTSLAVGMVAVVGAAVAAPGSCGRRAVATLLALAALAAVLAVPWSTIAFAHLHNLLAIVLWWLWVPRRRIHALVPILFVAGSGLLLGGGADRSVFALGALGHGPHAASFTDFAERLAPFDAPLASVRVALWFAFAQSVHYAVWLRMIPEDDRPRPGMRGFIRSYRSLVDDGGRPLVWAAGAVALGLAAWALVDLSAAHDGYLKLALFHGPLELAVVAWLFVARGAGCLRRRAEAYP